MLGSIIGSGAFGKVYQSLNDEKVVFKVVDIKYIEDEINILEKIGHNKYFCNLLKYFEKENNMYLKFNKYYCNLNEITIKLDQNKTLNISYQIVEALEYLEYIGVIHCDLKPENIMFETEKYEQIKIIDFGSSILKGFKKIYNNYVCTRWYCSPDIILGKPITKDIDIWSLGCIIYELFTNIVLFPGGGSENKYRRLQLYKIIEIIGFPNQNYLKDCKYKDIYLNDKKCLIPNKNKYTLIKIFDHNNNEIKLKERKIEDEISNINILKLLNLILRYENRLSIEDLKKEIIDLFSKKKIKC